MKKKIPYLDQFQTIDDAFNYLVKEINSATIKDSEVQQSSSVLTQLAEGELKTYSFTNSGGTTTVISVSVSHSLGSTPRAILYAGQVHAIDIYDGNPIVWRVSSSDSSQVTIEMRTIPGTRIHNFFILK